MSAAIVPAIIAASVAIVVAVLTPALSSLRAVERRSTLMFDAAASSLLLVQAARHVATGVERKYHPGSDEEYHRFTVGMAEKSISGFIDQTCRSAAVPRGHQPLRSRGARLDHKRMGTDPGT